MDLVTILGPILAISLLVERLLEGGFSLVEMLPNVQKMKTDDPRYGSMKPLISIVVGIILGIIIGNMLGITLFASFNLKNISPDADKLISGAIAGAAAPYSHQIIELLFKIQKLLQTKKEEMENTASAAK